MQEINAHDILDTNRNHFEYTGIKPETGITPSEAREQWDGASKELGEHKSELSDNQDNKSDGLTERNYNIENSERYPTYVKCSNEHLANKEHPETGVPYEKRILQMPNGEWIEGVFAKFDSCFDAKIPESLYLESNPTQFKECNRQLFEALEKDSKLKEMFTDEQIDQIKDGIQDGTAPDGYVWHHDAESGKLQLVDAAIHAKSAHRGGRSLWGSERFNH